VYLGIDIGTSGVKAVIVDGAGTVMSDGHAVLTVQRPKPLHSEQNPVAWWDAAQAAVLALDPKHRAAVKSIGLSGQMHGATVLGEGDDILRPAILWNDGRSAAECAAIEMDVPTSRDITGNCAMPGFTAPKLRWIKDNEPELFSKIRKVLLPKDYVRLCMTGDYASDMSDSAGTLWLDVANRSWSEAMLAATGLSAAHMPRLFEGSEITGTLRPQIAAEWGMEAVPVVAGGGDNAAGAVGSGVVDQGEGFLSLGTSGVIFLADDRYRPHADGGIHTFCHALPNRWHQMAVMLSAASAVDWVAGLCGFDSPAALYAAAEDTGKLSRGEIFLPYLSGERTPHNNPGAQGVFFGLTHETGPVDMAQAALEGVAFGLADGVQALRDSGAQIDSLSVIGGGSRSAYWGRILASVFDVPLVYRDSGSVGPAYGAARLARLGLTGEAVADVCTPPPIHTVIDPDPVMQDHLSERLSLFRSLYRSLSGAFLENQL